MNASPSGLAAPSGTVAPPEIAVASPSGLPVFEVDADLRANPGTYLVRLNPAFAMTVVRGTVDVNDTGSFGYHFGQDPGNDFFVNRVDKIPDLKHPGTLLDTPDDLVAWLSTAAGRSLVKAPVDIKVGGLPAKQFDVRSGRADEAWPMEDSNGTTQIPPGLPANRTARITVVDVAGKDVVIMFLPQEDHPTHFADAVAVFQPMIDSIVWQ